jgi:hypothetical protein
MAKYGGSTTLTHITTTACLHSPTTRTIALLNKNKTQICSFDKNFYTTYTELEKQWEERQYKLTRLQQKNTQKLLHKLYTCNIYSPKDITMPNGTTLMTPDNFKLQYNSCSKCIKTALYHYQLMFCQNNNMDINHPTNNPQEHNKLLAQYCTQYPIIQNPNQNQTPQNMKENTIPTPKQIYTKLHIHPIHQILDIKKTTQKDNYMTYKVENKYLSKWITPSNNTYIKWLLENKIFPYKKINITRHNNLVILEQHYKHQQNTHYSNSIFKHFYQRQHKDTRYIHPPIDTTYIYLDIIGCNPDKDIIATTPTIQTQDASSYLFDETCRHVYTIPTQRLKWLWTQYNKFQNNQIYIDPLLQNFETEVIGHLHTTVH